MTGVVVIFLSIDDGHKHDSIEHSRENWQKNASKTDRQHAFSPLACARIQNNRIFIPLSTDPFLDVKIGEGLKAYHSMCRRSERDEYDGMRDHAPEIEAAHFTNSNNCKFKYLCKNPSMKWFQKNETPGN